MGLMQNKFINVNEYYFFLLYVINDHTKTQNQLVLQKKYFSFKELDLASLVWPCDQDLVELL